MNYSADETRASLANNLRYFIKWSLIALLIGGTGGLIGSLFLWVSVLPLLFA